MNIASMYAHRAVFADICRRARPGDNTLRQWAEYPDHNARSRKWGGYHPVSFESKRTDTQWYFLDLPYAYVFVFRGTEPCNLRDWATDTMGWKKTIPYGNNRSRIRVHFGFLRAYKSVRDQVHATVRQRVVEHKPIVVLGHSLGGALATLCAVDIQYNMVDSDLPRRTIHTFTYGSPRVGNKAFSRSYNVRCGRTWRFWGWWDIVAKLPPWILGFRHVTSGFGLRCRHDVRKYIAKLDPFP